MEMFFGFLVGALLIAVGVCIYFVKKMHDSIEMMKTDNRYFDRTLEEHTKDIMVIREKMRGTKPAYFGSSEEDDGK